MAIVRLLVVCLLFLTAAGGAAALDLCRIESGSGVLTTSCRGTLQGGLCSGEWYIDIRFQAPFDGPPHVLVTPETVSAQAGCVQHETDIIGCYPEAITAEGFRLNCFGSPVPTACGSLNDFKTKARAQWIAVDSRSRCKAESGHGVKTASCDEPLGPASCASSYYAPITQAHPAKSRPHALAAPELVGHATPCAGVGIDKFICAPYAPTGQGFKLWCSGSPYSDLCADGSRAGLSEATGGWLTIHGRPNCPVQSGHFIEAAVCIGEMREELCIGEMAVEVSFPKEFAEPPHLILSPEYVPTGIPDCTGGAFDGVSCYAVAVTAKGFRAHCSSSPISNYCGVVPGMGAIATKLGYLAIAKHCEAESAESS